MPHLHLSSTCLIVISSHSCQVNLGLTPCPSHSCLHSVAQLSELCLGHHLGNESILNGTPSFPGWSPTELPNGQLHSSKSCIWLPLQSLRVDPACTLFLFYKFVAYAGDLDAFSKRPRSALLLPQDSSRPNAQLRQLQFRSWCMKCIESINPPVFLATSPCAGLRMTKDFSLWAGISMKWEMDKCSVLCFAVLACPQPQSAMGHLLLQIQETVLSQCKYLVFCLGVRVTVGCVSLTFQWLACIANPHTICTTIFALCGQSCAVDETSSTLHVAAFVVVLVA